MRKVAIRVLGICLCSQLVPAVWAQSAGQILGAVVDSSGGAVVGVTVTASEAGTGLTSKAVTGTDGRYVLLSLRPTAYEISAEAAGFRRFLSSGIELLANQSLTVNITMELGSVTETVTVSGVATQVDISTSTLSQVVDQARIIELPLNGRDATRLAMLVPGVVIIQVSTETTKNIPGGLRLSTGGSKQGQVAYNLDGVTNTDFYTQENQTFPAPDFLQEFSIQTSNYTAVYGNNAGAVVNVVTRSGTNDLHGGAFEFVRNRVFNARNTFAPTADFLKRNQYGAYFGGPVRLPHYNGRNKTFFFVGWQGTPIRNNVQNLTSFAPTADERVGNFSTCGAQCVKVIKDPVTGLPFPNNQIPLNRLNPVTLNLNKYIKTGTGAGLVVFGRSQADNLDQGVARVDHQINDNNRLSYRYFTDDLRHAPSYDPNNLLTYVTGIGLGSGIHETNMVLGWTKTFSPTLLNEFRLGFNRILSRRSPPPLPSMTQLGVRLPVDTDIPAIQSIAVTGFFTFGDFPAAAYIRNGFEVNEKMSKVINRHTISFGLSGSHYQIKGDNQINRMGTYAFSGDASGNAMADYMLGSLRTFKQGIGEYVDKRITYVGLFMQDDWKISKRLTLNLGLRYETTPPWHEQKGRFDVFSAAGFRAGVQSKVFLNAPPGLVFRGDPGVPYDGIVGDYNNFSPRLGFAWDVFGDGKTSLRGGGGFFYDQHFSPLYNIGASQAWPWGMAVNLTTPKGSFSDPYLGLDNTFNNYKLSTVGTPTEPNFPPTQITGMQSSIVTPVTYNWNLTLEREVHKVVARLAYVGSTQIHGIYQKELDPAVYIPGSSLGTDARRVFAPYYSTMVNTTQDSVSHYHSLQASMTKRLSQGFTVLANYTFSKSMDDGTRNGVLSGGGTGATSEVAPIFYMPGARRMVYGPSDFDHRHVFVLSYVWQLPKLNTSNLAARHVLNGWEVSGIANAQSGSPLTLTSGLDNSKTGIGRDRAQLTGVSSAAPVGADPTVWFNSPAYTLNPVGTFGNYGIGQLYGPGLFTWDMGMFKTIPIKERLTMQFRAEFFNIFNHVNYNNPLTIVNGPGFGTINSTHLNAGDPRIIQFGLKILF